MADTKGSALSSFTPVLSDLLYGIDDPGGTPTSGKFTLTALRDLLSANAGTLLADAGSNSAPAYSFAGETATGLYKSGTGSISIVSGSTEGMRFESALGGSFRSGGLLWWSSSSTVGAYSARDVVLSRAAAGVLRIAGASAGAALQFPEMTAPAGATDAARLYAEDNGAGKTRLMVIFPTGAAQQIAIEP